MNIFFKKKHIKTSFSCSSAIWQICCPCHSARKNESRLIGQGSLFCSISDVFLFWKTNDLFLFNVHWHFVCFKGVKSHGIEVTDSCNCHVGAAMWIKVLWKNCPCTSLLSQFCSPILMTFSSHKAREDSYYKMQYEREEIIIDWLCRARRILSKCCQWLHVNRLGILGKMKKKYTETGKSINSE